MLKVVNSFDVWLDERLPNDVVSREARAYICGVFRAVLKQNDAVIDMSNASIIVAYSNARNSGDFLSYQRVGDWVLWADTFVQEHIKDDRDVTIAAARLSYYSCYRLLKRSFKLYEELADELPTLTERLRKSIR